MTCHAENIPVVDEWGEVLYETDDRGARELLNLRKATMQMAGRIRLLRVTLRKRTRPDETGDWAGGVHLPDPFDELARKERHEVLELCKEQLSEPNRRLLRLRYWNDLTFVETSEAMHVTPPAVIAMHQRVLEKIGEQLRAMGIVRLEQI